MRKIWGLILAVILVSGCGINDYIVYRYPWQDIRKTYNRPDTGKIIGFYDWYKSNLSFAPITLSEKTLTIYNNPIMEKIYFQYRFDGQATSHSLSFDCDWFLRNRLLAVVTKGEKTIVNTFNLTFDDNKPEVNLIQVDDCYDEIIACYNIDMFRKFVIIHSKTKNKLGIVDAHEKTCKEYDVPNAVFADVSCIRQKLKINDLKAVNYKSTELSCFLASYDGKEIKLYDCDNGALLETGRIALPKSGSVEQAKMSSGTVYCDKYSTPHMTNLSLFDGQTLFIFDLVQMKIVYETDMSNFKESIYHNLFLSKDGLYFYDVPKNKLVRLIDGDLKVIAAQTNDGPLSDTLFYISSEHQNDSVGRYFILLKVWEGYDAEAKDKHRNDISHYGAIKTFAQAKYQAPDEACEVIYNGIVYTKTKIVSYLETGEFWH